MSGGCQKMFQSRDTVQWGQYQHVTARLDFRLDSTQLSPLISPSMGLILPTHDG